MAEKRKFPVESDVSSEERFVFNSLYSRERLLSFYEITEEDLSSEASKRPKTDINKPFCDPCFIDKFIRVIALYMCYVCGRYYCNNCFSVHDKSHGYICMESEGEQLEREIDEYLSYLKNESDADRKEKFMKNNVCVCDYVDMEHGLDKVEHCGITGLTGYGYRWWVVCDSFNSCIKVFSLGSNVLQRYIRFVSDPYDVTEIIVENKTTEQDSASCSETAISGTENKPDGKHLLAVTLPGKRLILIIDLGKNPAVIHNKFKTEKECRSIDFYDGNIFIVGWEPSLDSPCSVSIKSVEGVTLKTVQTDFPLSWYVTYLTVLNSNIYTTDRDNHRVVCYNDEGRILHEIKIDRSWPIGICVDRSDDKVYISSLMHNKVYELESDLSRYKSVLDQITRYMENPREMCFYSDKLYVGHSWPQSHITVVRLL